MDVTVYTCPNQHQETWHSLRRSDHCPVCGGELVGEAYVPEIDAAHELALEMNG